MLNKFLFASIVLATASYAQAKPYIVKVNEPGEQASWVTETCEVYKDKVVITRQYGSIDDEAGSKTIHQTPAQFQVDFESLIKEASKRKIRASAHDTCDYPTTSVHAQSSQSQESVLLFDSGGCGDPRAERQGNAAAALRGLVDSFCPETHDPANDDRG